MYYPAVEKLLKEATGATRVLIFDHTKRNGHVAVEAAAAAADGSGGKVVGKVSNPAGQQGQPPVTSVYRQIMQPGFETCRTAL